MSTYSFSFCPAKDLMLLQDHLTKNGIPHIEGISHGPNNTTVHTHFPLDPAAQANLYRLVETFDESAIELEGNFINILTIPQQINSSGGWTTVCTWAFPGTNAQVYKKVKVLCESATAPFYLRIYDATNIKIIVSKEFAPSTTLCELPVSDLYYTPSLLQLQALTTYNLVVKLVFVVTL